MDGWVDEWMKKQITILLRKIHTKLCLENRVSQIALHVIC